MQSHCLSKFLSQTESSHFNRNPHDWEDFATGSGLSHIFGLLTNRKLLGLKVTCVNGASSVDNRQFFFLSVTFCHNVTAPLMRGMVCRGACRYLEFWRKSLKQNQLLTSLRVILVSVQFQPCIVLLFLLKVLPN